MSRPRWVKAVASAVLGLVVSACASSEGAKRTDDTTPSIDDDGASSTDDTGATSSNGGTPGAPGEAGSEAAPGKQASPPAAGATGSSSAAPVADARRSADGIDDDVPLPPAGAARAQFDDAVALAARDPRAAERAFLAAAEKTTYFYAAYFNAGAAAERASDVAGAEKHYRKALEQRADYAPALVNLYILLERTNRSQEANRVVDDALARMPDRAGPHVVAAERARRKGDVESVRASALRAIQLDERQVAAMRQMAWVFRQQKRLETARFALENALVLEPGNALLHLDLGYVLLALDEKKRAAESFDRARGLRPELVEGHENLALLALELGDPVLGLSAIEKALALRPNDARLILQHANALRANKRYPEAETAYKKALAADATLGEVHFNLGLLYLDNEIPGVDALVRWRAGMDAFAAFEKSASLTGPVRSRLDSYKKDLNQLITREEKKRARDAQRKPSDGAANSDGEGGDE